MTELEGSSFKTKEKVATVVPSIIFKEGGTSV